MHVLITGKPRTGKTTLIKKIVALGGEACGGFYTEELKEGEQRVGFKIKTTDGGEGLLAKKGLESPCRLGKYGILLENLDSLGVGAVEKAIGEKRSIVIDEIGKMELFSSQFREVVLKALDSGNQVIGVIHLARLPYLDEIRTRDDVKVFEVDGKNNAEVWDEIKPFLRILKEKD